MPVLIRGLFSGGGKIKDADALPEDVRKGKAFYNNEGKQTGTADIAPFFEASFPKNSSTGLIKSLNFSGTYISGYVDFSYNSPIEYLRPGKSTVIGVGNNAPTNAYGVSASPNIDIKKIRQVTLTVGPYKYEINFYLYFRGNKGLQVPLYDNINPLVLDANGMYNGYFFMQLKNDIITHIGFSGSSGKSMNLKYDCKITIN